MRTSKQWNSNYEMLFRILKFAADLFLKSAVTYSYTYSGIRFCISGTRIRTRTWTGARTWIRTGKWPRIWTGEWTGTRKSNTTYLTTSNKVKLHFFKTKIKSPLGMKLKILLYENFPVFFHSILVPNPNSFKLVLLLVK